MRQNDAQIKWNTVLTGVLTAVVLGGGAWGIDILSRIYDSSVGREQQLNEVVTTTRTLEKEIEGLRQSMVVKKDADEILKRIQILEQAKQKETEEIIKRLEALERYVRK